MSRELSTDEAELLAEVDALEMPDREVERAAELSPSFLYRARKGLASGPRASASWDRLRAWLEATDTAAGPAPADEVPIPGELTAAIEQADTLAKLDAVLKRVTMQLVDEDMDRSLGAVVIDALKEQRQVLRLRRQEEAQAALTALELLTPDEADLLRAHRAKLAGPPLQPGEVSPPPGTPAS